MVTKTLAVEATLTNILLEFLNAEVFVDPIPHFGVSEGNKIIRKGLFGHGSKISVDTPEGEITKGKRVVYRKEIF